MGVLARKNARGEYDYIPDGDMDRMARSTELDVVCGRYRKISKEYEFLLVGKAQEGCLRSRDFLMLNYLSLLISEIQRLCPGKDVREYLDAAVVGMYRGIDRFDVMRGSRLMSYAVWWVRQGVNEALRAEDLIRSPDNQVDDLVKIMKVGLDIGDEMGLGWAGKKAGLGPGRIEKVYEVLHRRSMESLDRPIRNRDGSFMGTLRDTLVDSDAVMPVDYAVREDVKRTLDSVVATLRKDERIAIRSYYGLDGCHKKETLESVGKKFGVSKERVRQIIQGAIPKLITGMACRGVTDDVLEIFD